ncbi:hypothetical protein QN277_020647 [Acacia crassicarpa]|uniref:non-specific serine/threonine protein kinase n=1 Tax=Acacia crassicarpa TaxID=499986 RepID=A0AAE1KDE3_9FABA|nr:hypothetical protein QN277_020647 [Acacia crassicarpa]
MDKPLGHNAENNNSDSLVCSLQDPSFSKMNNNSNVESQSSIESNSYDESHKSSSSCVSNYSNSCDANDSGLRSFFPCKPHKGNDIRWDSIQFVKAKYGDLGLGHFRLLKKLGFGDIGSVYLAELKGKGCLFAMKVMDKEKLTARKKMSRVQTERDILSSLDHPFLPTLYSHFETEKFSCLLMEFCNGGDLHVLRQRQPGKYFTEQAARFYASEILLALEYLHMMGVIYRDLKPENVLVREDGHIMLSDFDLSLRCCVRPTLVQSNGESSSQVSSSYCVVPSSCIDPSCKLPVCVEPSCLQLKPSCFKPHVLSSKKTRPKTVKQNSTSPDSYPMLIAEPTNVRSMSFVGTHEYLAPEIMRGDGHGSAVDWWTFGIFLYELLHGKTPFKGSTGNRETLFNIVGQPLRFPEGSNISFAAKDLIRGLLVKDPKKRLGFQRGASEIKQHAFFQSVNWALVRSKQPPLIPKPLDLAVLNETLKMPVPSDNSNTSSGPYLEFQFF